MAMQWPSVSDDGVTTTDLGNFDRTPSAAGAEL